MSRPIGFGRWAGLSREQHPDQHEAEDDRRDPVQREVTYEDAQACREHLDDESAGECGAQDGVGDPTSRLDACRAGGLYERDGCDGLASRDPPSGW